MLNNPVPKGAIFHATSHRRREVAITSELRLLVEETDDAIRAMPASGKLPPPTNDARINECSLKGICQPEALVEQGRLRCLREGLFSAAG